MRFFYEILLLIIYWNKIYFIIWFFIFITNDLPIIIPNSFIIYIILSLFYFVIVFKFPINHKFCFKILPYKCLIIYNYCIIFLFIITAFCWSIFIIKFYSTKTSYKMSIFNWMLMICIFIDIYFTFSKTTFTKRLT